MKFVNGDQSMCIANCDTWLSGEPTLNYLQADVFVLEFRWYE